MDRFYYLCNYDNLLKNSQPTKEEHGFIRKRFYCLLAVLMAGALYLCTACCLRNWQEEVVIILIPMKMAVIGMTVMMLIHGHGSGFIVF